MSCRKFQIKVAHCRSSPYMKKQNQIRQLFACHAESITGCGGPRLHLQSSATTVPTENCVAYTCGAQRLWHKQSQRRDGSGKGIVVQSTKLETHLNSSLVRVLLLLFSLFLVAVVVVVIVVALVVVDVPPPQEQNQSPLEQAYSNQHRLSTYVFA
eukprot:1025903-Amphidinium_carterae.1